MGIRRALNVVNHSEYVLFIRYKKIRSRALGWVMPHETGRFAVGDQSGYTPFTLTAVSESSSDVWEDTIIGDFEDYEWEVYD